MTIDDQTAIIRPRDDKDMPQLGDLLKRVHDRDGYPVEGVADPIAWLVSDRLLGAWVADLAGKVVGHVILTLASESDDSARIWMSTSSDSLESIAVLGRLFVDAAARGQGLGRKLAMTATRQAETLGKRAVLDVMAKDKTAIRTYENLGWRRLASITHKFGDQVEPGFAYVSPGQAS